MPSLHQKYHNGQKKTVNLARNMVQNNLIFCDLHYTYSDIHKNFNINELSSVSSCSVSNTNIIKGHQLHLESINKDYSPKSFISHNSKVMQSGLFGKKISVYMTLSDKLCQERQSSGTQATAAMNKCFQVYDTFKEFSQSMTGTNSDFCSTCTMSTLSYRDNRNSIMKPEKLYNPEIYFFGKKKDDKQKGMGSKLSKYQNSNEKSGSDTSISKAKTNTKATGTSSKSSIHSNSKSIAAPKGVSEVSKQKSNLPIKPSKGAATASGTSKSVTISDEKVQKLCPAIGTKKGEMIVTISHIKIGPRLNCPVHGSEPCQGPKCILASSREEQTPVKVTTVNNPRRGVFEIVIRKLTGAPLARNELMLEWTPPPSRPIQCNTDCPLPHISPSTCHHSKCRIIICRPSSHCRPKCHKKIPCTSVCPPKPCNRCNKTRCCKSPCSKCKTCCSKKFPCGHFPPCKSPCKPTYERFKCSSPCKSSPCLRPCPVGRKRPRKYHSQPKIKSRRKRVSPCYNRSKACPVVRCRSVPRLCYTCGEIRPFCLPRKCCSVLPCKPSKVCSSNISICNG